MEDLKKALEEFHEDGIVITDSSDKHVSFRLNATNRKGWDEWLEKFSEVTSTSWNVHRTFPNVKTYMFRKVFICHHNQYRKKCKGWKIHTKCPAILDVKIKFVNRYARYRDNLIESNPCFVVIKNGHNHSLQTADALGQLKLCSTAKETFYKYFEAGLSASQVYRLMQFEMITDDLSFMANNHLLPKQSAVYYLWKKWRTQTCGTYTGEHMLGAIKKYATSCEAKIAVKEFDERFVCALATPFMLRVHEQVKQSSEIIFIDTTSHIDQTNCSTTILLCNSPIGALPLGVIVSSGQDEECYYQGFMLLCGLLGDTAFFASTPQVFMTDDSAAEKNAIRKVWPHSTQLLCIFHVLQAVWRWLLSSKHSVDKDVRQLLMRKFQDILYSKTVQQMQETYALLADLCAQKKCGDFLSYADKLMERCKEWCLAHRQDVLTRGNNTNNVSESVIRIIKDVVFDRCKAYNPCQVVQLIVEVFSPYFQSKIMNTIFGKTPRYSRNALVLDKDNITKVSDFQYQVRSATHANEVYTVDIDCGLCSCQYGSCGRLCKHQHSAIVHYLLVSEYCFRGSAEEKHKWACIALGQDRAKGVSFYRSMTEGFPQNASSVDVVTPSVDRAEEFGQQTSTSNVVDSDDDFISAPNRDETRALNQQLMSRLLSNVQSKFEMRSTEATAALTTFNSVIEKIKTPSHMYNFIHNLPKSVGRRSFGRKIAVQPTTVARRSKGAPKGVAPLGKGRPPTALPGGPPKKRRRKLTHNVKCNQANAKTH